MTRSISESHTRAAASRTKCGPLATTSPNAGHDAAQAAEAVELPPCGLFMSARGMVRVSSSSSASCTASPAKPLLTNAEPLAAAVVVRWCHLSIRAMSRMRRGSRIGAQSIRFTPTLMYTACLSRVLDPP